jgi:hypothetical protein
VAYRRIAFRMLRQRTTAALDYRAELQLVVPSGSSDPASPASDAGSYDRLGSGFFGIHNEAALFSTMRLCANSK